MQSLIFQTDSLDIKNLTRELKSFVKQKSYPCIAAARAAAKGDLRVWVYDSLERTDPSLATQLLDYIEEQKSTNNTYLTFVAIFKMPQHLSDEDFEDLMWKQLQMLNDISSPKYAWDKNASNDPNDPKFCFSFGGEAMFVVGMHPGSVRLSRRFAHPTLVFNLYRQFEDLKALGLYEPMQKTNRKRDVTFQGSENPMLTRFGEDAEAIQYSGRDHQKFWQCPFRHKN